MGDQESLSFEGDIKGLFREKDQAQMKWAFDLWRYEDVKEQAQGILERLQEGDMPCDGEWPAAQIDVFRRWVAQGMNP
jgi:hypothetical protein